MKIVKYTIVNYLQLSFGLILNKYSLSKANTCKSRNLIDNTTRKKNYVNFENGKYY